MNKEEALSPAQPGKGLCVFIILKGDRCEGGEVAIALKQFIK
jgi:hypothetical protein